MCEFLGVIIVHYLL